jgi:transposase
LSSRSFGTETSISEVSYEIDVLVEYRVKEISRIVYKKGCDCQSPIVTTPAPPKIIPKGKFSIAFWSKVLFDKYILHIPIRRQALQMKLFNLPTSTGTLFGGLKTLSNYFKPLYEIYRQESEKAMHHHIDETRWKMFFKVIGKKNYLWWLWVFASKKVIFYVIDQTRSAAVPKEHLNRFFSRIISVDRYSAYKTLGENILLAFCWAHVRRDFIRILIRYPHKRPLCKWAKQWIKWIGQLYAINKRRMKHRDNPALFSKYQHELEQAVSKMQERFKETYAFPEQRKVIASLKNHWKGLTLFVECPDIPMDNNTAERVLRDPIIGRKNSYGNHSEWGGLLSAMMYTFNQTCLLHDINPHAYIAYYLEECAKNGGAPTNLEHFLPHKLREAYPEMSKSHPALFIHHVKK